MTTEAEKLNYVLDKVTGIINKPEKKWFCNDCRKEVHGIEHYLPDGSDDNMLGEVVCAECGNLLWED